jgi:hypothetical protein
MMKARLIDRQPIYLELYDAIAYFLARQRLVIRAVADQGIEPSEIGSGVSDWHGKSPQRGKWGEWGFLFHGSGCRLTHPQTREAIDWNGPDIDSFDTYFFIEHLEWRLTQKHYLPLLHLHIKANGTAGVVKLIDDLIADGFISEDYRLNPHVDSTSQASAA